MDDIRDYNIAEGIISLLQTKRDRINCDRLCKSMRVVGEDKLKFCQSLLYYATKANCEDVVRILTNHGADVNAKQSLVRTKNHQNEESSDVVEIYSEDGSFVRGKTVINEAEARKIMSFLQCGIFEGNCTEHCESIRGDKSKLCQSLLYVSTKCGSEDVVRLLTKHGVDLNIKFDLNWFRDIHFTPLSMAALFRNYPIVKLLLNSGADVDVKVLRYYNIFRIAAREGDTEIVKLIFHAGAYSFKRDLNSALRASIKSENKELVVLLLNEAIKRGFGKNNAELAKLCYVVKMTKMEVEDFLLNGDPDIKANCGTWRLGVLDTVLSVGNREIVKFLIDRGADIHLIEIPLDRLALHSAAKRKDDDDYFVKFVLNCGINVNGKDWMGDTALFEAVKLNSVNIVKSLLLGGADINIVNEAGDTVFSVVANEIMGDKKRFKVAKILVTHVALIKANNCLVSEKNLRVISRMTMLNDFLLKCESEIERMKKMQLDDELTLSVFDVYRATSDAHLMGLAKNGNVTNLLKTNFKSKFRIYGNTVVKNIKSGMARNKSFDKFIEAFNFSSTSDEVKLPKLPMVCLYKIFSYHSNCKSCL